MKKLHARLITGAAVFLIGITIHLTTSNLFEASKKFVAYIRNSLDETVEASTLLTKPIHFIDVFRVLNITPVITDPEILEKVQNNSTRSHIYGDVSSLTVFGVLYSESFTHFTSNEFLTVTHIKQQLPWDVTPVNNSYHIVCLKIKRFNVTSDITLVVLYKTKHFVYIPSCEHKGNELPLGQTVLSMTPMVFDRIKLKRLTLTRNFDVYIPLKIQDFVIQYTLSRYLPCQHETSGKYRNNREPEVKAASTIKAAIYLKHKLKSIGMLPMIFGGTLLGWYRQCDIIRASSDVDFALFASDIGLPLHTLLRTDGNVKGVTFNIPRDGFQYQIYIFGQKFDIYFMFDTGTPDEVYIGAWAPDRDKLTYTYPRSEVCSAILLGVRFNVPCRIESLIAAEYGANWREPVSSWSWISSPHNVKNHGAWSNEIWPLAHVDIKTNTKILDLFNTSVDSEHYKISPASTVR